MRATTVAGNSHPPSRSHSASKVTTLEIKQIEGYWASAFGGPSASKG